MAFRWNPQFLPEQAVHNPPPIWLYLLLYVVVEGFALAVVVPDLPKGSIPWDRVLRHAVAAPFFCWLALSFFVYWSTYDNSALLAADHNAARWQHITDWQHQNRSGIAVLDSVILTPEPDLAERMLALEGTPPENPGKVMPLAGIAAEDDDTRLDRLLDALLTPLAARLAQAVEAGSFVVVMQCDHEQQSGKVLEAWRRLALPGEPVVRWLDNSRDIGFADIWFEDEARRQGWHAPDSIPRYRLLLAWHLNKGGPDVKHTDSEAAVALLLGSPALMYGKPDIRRQAWLLRQITGDADQVDRSLAWLLKAEQVPSGRIRHFWHSGLKGMAQHATLGAVTESALKVEAHALEPAIGPQAPVARWVIQALAAKMAHFGQGPQLVALPHEQGVALNLVAKEPAPVEVPWKEEYGYNPILGPDLAMCASLWAAAMLFLPSGWDTSDTIVTWLVAATMVFMFILRHPRPVARAAQSAVEFVLTVIGF